MYYEYLDLPSPPQELILPLEQVLQLENIFGGHTKNYTIHEVQPELRDWLQNIFPDRTKFRYQTLIKDIPCHVDRGRDTAINFLIDTGGNDVTTAWYTDEFGDKIDDVVLELSRWHKLRVDQWHTVHNINWVRFAITVA